MSRLSKGLGGLLLATVMAVGGAQVARADGETCGQYGTTLQFADSPAAAAQQALKEEKLVFILHVSGNFEDSAFT